MSDDINLPKFFDPEWAPSAQELLWNIRRWLTDTNPNCLVHPHGFYVVPLRRSADCDWRFHYWPQGPRELRGMPAFIHTHDRQVDSLILHGEMKNVVYNIEVSEMGASPLYQVEYLGDKYSRATSNRLVITNERVNAIELEAKVVEPFGSYCVERHSYHEAQVPNDIATATLVCMHNFIHGPVYVVGCDGYPDVIEFQRSSCEGAELACLLDDQIFG